MLASRKGQVGGAEGTAGTEPSLGARQAPVSEFLFCHIHIAKIGASYFSERQVFTGTRGLVHFTRRSGMSRKRAELCSYGAQANKM